MCVWWLFGGTRRPMQCQYISRHTGRGGAMHTHTHTCTHIHTHSTHQPAVHTRGSWRPSQWHTPAEHPLAVRVCACVYVHACVCVCVTVCVRPPARAREREREREFMFIQGCVCAPAVWVLHHHEYSVCVFKHVQVCIQACVSACMQASYVPVHAGICVCVCALTRVCTHMHPGMCL